MSTKIKVLNEEDTNTPTGQRDPKTQQEMEVTFRLAFLSGVASAHREPERFSFAVANHVLDQILTEGEAAELETAVRRILARRAIPAPALGCQAWCVKHVTPVGDEEGGICHAAPADAPPMVEQAAGAVTLVHEEDGAFITVNAKTDDLTVDEADHLGYAILLQVAVARGRLPGGTLPVPWDRALKVFNSAFSLGYSAARVSIHELVSLLREYEELPELAAFREWRISEESFAARHLSEEEQAEVVRVVMETLARRAEAAQDGGR